VFISVAAGVREKSMRKWLTDGAAIVRCMPNTPALLGLGSTGLLANEHCSAKQRADAESLLQAAGITVWVEQEAQLDAVTAVSGSGPAYFFYLIEHMIEAGVTLGLDKSTASDLAIETAFGAASMARAREHSPATLRENVTSKNGTTAAALEAFAAADTPAIIARAMQAANDRAVSMGDDYGDD
jgi:pyrroline-5-carboxylate reductase